MIERKMELDMIRVMACFFVVMIHVAGYGMEILNPISANWMIRNLVVCATRCAVPVFFMISGVLFMEKEIPLRVLYKKYIGRLVFAWGFWSALYAFIDYMAYRKKGSAGLKYFMYRFSAGHYHMWFLAALLTVYVFLPILQKMVRACSGFHMKYLGIIILIGVIGKETLDPFLAGPTWNAIWNNLKMLEVSAGMIYFVLGYCIYKNQNFFSTKVCFILYILSVTIMSGTNAVCAYLSGEHAAVADGYLHMGVLVSATVFFMFLLQKMSTIQIFDTKILKWIVKAAGCTFGIYLVHTLFIEQVYRRIGLTQDRFPVVISIVGFSIMTFFISFAVSWCMRKIPVIGKWIA